MKKLSQEKRKNNYQRMRFNNHKIKHTAMIWRAKDIMNSIASQIPSNARQILNNVFISPIMPYILNKSK